MTKEEWFSLDAPLQGLEWVRSTASVRKHRLFAVACWRKVKIHFLHNAAYEGFETVERLAEGTVTEGHIAEYREHLWYEAFKWIDGYREERENNCRSDTTSAVRDALQSAASFTSSPERLPLFSTSPSLMSSHISLANAIAHLRRGTDTHYWNDVEDHHRQSFRSHIAEELKSQMPLFHDIFGNPFRPVTFDPAWRTATTTGLVAAMYESRSFANMPILADALEEAGCDYPDVLAHCRDEAAAHVRGCWVVDLVLGKS